MKPCNHQPDKLISDTRPNTIGTSTTWTSYWCIICGAYKGINEHTWRIPVREQKRRATPKLHGHKMWCHQCKKSIRGGDIPAHTDKHLKEDNS